MSLNFTEEWKKYRRRNGETTKAKLHPSGIFNAKDECGDTFTIQGFYLASEKEHPFDLVEEIPEDPPTEPAQPFNPSGSKYLRPIIGATPDGKIDVYGILLTFNVQCPASQHAIKKLLCAGIRGKGDTLQDLREARDAIDRAIQLGGE